MLKTLKKLINKIDNPAERRVLVLRLGLNGTYNSIEKIAEKMAITEGEVKILISSAVSNLKNPIQEKLSRIIK